MTASTTVTTERAILAGGTRTLLFVPGARPERYDKAAAAGADQVIIDLEDAVPAANKATARTSIRDWLPTGRTLVRVNPTGTDHFIADITALRGIDGLTGVVLPKTESPDDIDRVLNGLGRRLPVVALIETAAGLLQAAAIASHPSVAVLAFGNLDFAADCGLQVQPPQELELLPARAHLTYVSRVAGLPGPVDGVTADVTDKATAATDSARALRLGFSGKLCIRPAQIGIVLAAFAPTEQQVDWAKRVTAAVTEGVGSVDGAMVDRPVILLAQQILQRHAQ